MNMKRYCSVFDFIMNWVWVVAPQRSISSATLMQIEAYISNHEGHSYLPYPSWFTSRGHTPDGDYLSRCCKGFSFGWNPATHDLDLSDSFNQVIWYLSK